MNKRKWKPINKRAWPAVRSLLKQLEPLSVNSYSALRCDEVPAKIPTDKKVFILETKKEDHLQGLLLSSTAGHIFPFILDDDYLKEDDFFKEARSLLKFKYLHSIQGRKKTVEKCLNELAYKKNCHFDYHLMMMRQQPKQPGLKIEKGISYKKALMSDFEKIFPLQAAYEKEEVLANPFEFDAQICQLNLKKRLRSMPYYLLFLDNTLASMACINRKGQAFKQIGAVYTRKEMRGRGYAARVLKFLMDSEEQTDQGFSLFVKQNNPAACRLYQKLGFSVQGDFCITYLNP